MSAEQTEVKVKVLSDLAIGAGSSLDLSAWLEEQAQAHQFEWLLAFADDGVIWGYLDGQSLKLSGSIADFADYSPPLHPITLQQARLFGEKGELLIWRTSKGLTGRLLLEGSDGDLYPAALDTRPLLWGTQEEGQKDGFVLLCEGEQGLRHAPPLKEASVSVNAKTGKQACLTVRNYISYDDETGQAYVSLSRLVSIDAY